MRGSVLSVAVLAVVLVACGRGDPPSPPVLDTGYLEPGPVVADLCIHARVDARRGLIRYRARNAGEEPIAFLEGHVGARLEVKRVDESASYELALRPDALRFYSGLGPTPQDLRRLAPEAFMPRSAQHLYVDQRRFTPEGTPRPGLDVPPAEEEFVLDLLDYLWPEALGSLDEGDLELRVVQVHAGGGGLPGLDGITGFRVPSLWLLLDLGDVSPVVRASLDRSPE